MPTILDTFMRVCTLEDGHDGDHVAYHAAPDKDGFGNKAIAHPRCLHVDPVPADTEIRYRVVFEMIDPRFPQAGWHEVARETSDLADAQRQAGGLLRLEAEGDDVRNPRIEAGRLVWESL